jgi:hypothetical protein
LFQLQTIQISKNFFLTNQAKFVIVFLNARKSIPINNWFHLLQLQNNENNSNPFIANRTPSSMKNIESWNLVQQKKKAFSSKLQDNRRILEIEKQF